MASPATPSMRLVLLAATVRATSAALALPSVLTTRGHNATAYVVAAAPGGCGAAPHLRVACGKPRRVFAEELPAAVLITRCAFSKASCRCPDGGARACSAKWVPDHERQVLHRFQILGRHLARRPCAPGDPRCAAIAGFIEEVGGVAPPSPAALRERVCGVITENYEAFGPRAPPIPGCGPEPAPRSRRTKSFRVPRSTNMQRRNYAVPVVQRVVPREQVWA